MPKMSRIPLKDWAEMDGLLLKMSKQGLKQRLEFLREFGKNGGLTEIEVEEIILAQKFIEIIEECDKKLEELLKNMPIIPTPNNPMSPIGGGNNPMGGGPMPGFN